MPDLKQLVETYGYLALLVGTFLEGETILIVAGMAAHSGLLDLPQCIFWAFLGSTAGDQLYFFIGRYKGQWLLARKPAWRGRIEKALRRVERHANWLLLTFRFMYGLRNVTTLAFGLSRIPIWRFATLNVIGATIWAVSFGVGGFLFGEALVEVMEDVRHYQVEILGVICLISLTVWFIRLLLRRKSARADLLEKGPSRQDQP
jgi:membrane protein DedA with SNARE-associated domain